MSTDLGTELFKAAQAGDVPKLKALLEPNPGGVDVKNNDVDQYTPLMVAAMANKKEAVNFLLEKGADVKLRDSKSYTIFTLTLNEGHKDLAQFIVERCRELGVSDLKVTDPRLEDGAKWLRDNFNQTRKNITDEDSKPKPELLDDLLKYPNLVAVEGRKRDVSEVYWEHIFLRFIGDVPMDIKRNYSTELVLTLCGTFEVILKGHEGIRKSAELLNSKLLTTEYDIVGTVIRPTGSWVTERWGYHDPNVNQVVDGIDTFLIMDGKIKVKMINYTVEDAESREVYRKKMGLPIK